MSRTYLNTPVVGTIYRGANFLLGPFDIRTDVTGWSEESPPDSFTLTVFDSNELKLGDLSVSPIWSTDTNRIGQFNIVGAKSEGETLNEPVDGETYRYELTATKGDDLWALAGSTLVLENLIKAHPAGEAVETSPYATLIDVNKTVAEYVGGSAELMATLSNLGDLLANDPDGIVALTAQIAAISGGSDVLDATLITWAGSLSTWTTNTTYDADGIVNAAILRWPDGSAGAFTVTEADADLGLIKAWTATHDQSGKTVTQAAITFGAGGDEVNKPPLTVA